MVGLLGDGVITNPLYHKPLYQDPRRVGSY